MIIPTTYMTITGKYKLHTACCVDLSDATLNLLWCQYMDFLINVCYFMIYEIKYLMMNGNIYELLLKTYTN